MWPWTRDHPPSVKAQADVAFGPGDRRTLEGRQAAALRSPALGWTPDPALVPHHFVTPGLVMLVRSLSSLSLKSPPM